MFSWNDYSPVDPECDEWDVVVIGAGLGGGFLGLSLAEQRLKVLFVERGRGVSPYPPPPPGRLKRLFSRAAKEADLARRGRWSARVATRIEGRLRNIHLPMGNGPGGSSAVYGAALERFLREDFTGESGAGPDALPNKWPIPYDAFLPYYRKAEALLRICGTRDPNDPDDDSTLRQPPTLCERDQWLFEQFEAAGLQPYRVHVGVDYKPGCTECLGDLCPRDCKSEGASRALKPALVKHGAKLLTGFEADRLHLDDDRIQAVIGRCDGRQMTIRGRLFVLAAGALATPLILLRSKTAHWPNGLGNNNDLVGRGLMFHVCQVFGAWAPRDKSTAGPGKSLSSRAFYIVGGKRLGSIQSLSAKVKVGQIAGYIENEIALHVNCLAPFARFIALSISTIVHSYFQSASLYATETEDFAYPENRIVLNPESQSGYTIIYDSPRELHERTKSLRKKILESLRQCKVMFLSGDKDLNLGHPAGTCRFGESPADSVLDTTNRLRGVNNLYICDASFMPTIGAINPGLTIAANALRVADIIALRLRDAAVPDARTVKA